MSLPAAGASADADQALLLEVQVNGQSTGKIGEFVLKRGRLMARRADLLDLGFKVPDSVVSNPGGLISLASMPGWTWEIDEKNQVLRVTVDDNRLVPTLLETNGAGSSEDRRTIESGKGATLNYDIADTLASGETSATGLLDFRTFSPEGIVSSAWLADAGTGPSTNKLVRLDSAYTFADVNTLRRYSVGDFVSGGLSWSRPLHMEGLQVRSDFSMRPDLVTFPLPTMTGSAAVPSTVDILANGNLIISNQVTAGPFETPQLPVISGAGTISMTVTNALGQQVTVTQPFYASSTLLRAGLQTFAGQFGLVRRNWGSASNDYGKLAGIGIYRRGLSSKFTVEGSVEATPGASMAGAGGVAQVGHLGIINFSTAGSIGSGNLGAQVSVGVQRIGRGFSGGASESIATGNYRDVAAVNGDGVTRKQLSLFTSFSARRFGSIGVAYAEVHQDAARTSLQANIVPAGTSHIFSANYSFQFKRVSIYASDFRSFASTSDSNGLQIGVTIPFGRRGSVNLSGSSDKTGQVQVQKSASQIGEWGYNGYVSAGDLDHEFGQVQYKSRVGLLTAGTDRSAGQTSLRLEAQGAVSFVDRGFFPSNTIYDSFAIVDTSPMAHVHVFQENRDVGETAASGRLLVPDMRAFDLNHLAIESDDIPADTTINNALREVRPQDRSGVVVRFGVKISHGALLQLVDEKGLPVPVGSTATLKSTGVTVPVGYDGKAYIEDLSLHDEVTVELADGRHCSVVFDYKAVAGEIPLIGPLSCLEKRP